MISKLLILICALIIFVDAAEKYKIIKTEDGFVRAKQSLTLFDEKPYYSFKGIPFAKSPVGNLRFKPPQQVEQWHDVRDTFEFGNECVQTSFMTKEASGSEDCLFLNVYIPETLPDEKLSVMVFIYGGGYQMGSSNIYGPDFLLNNNIILVTVNYRLGPFGFLSLGTPEYSGNMGLKDQLAALKWVNQNIEHFGGDKKNITLFGGSAGASSTHLHMLSPASSGLFQRAILQSGSVLSTWAFYLENNHRNYLYNYASVSEKTVQSLEELMEYLLTVDPLKFSKDTFNDLFIPGLPRKEVDLIWAPIVEVENAEYAFLTESPENYLLEPSDNIDTLIGSTSAEMYFIMSPEVMNPDLLSTFDKSFELQFPIKALRYNYASKEYKKMAKDVRKFYFKKDGKINSQTFSEYNDLMSDCWFVYGVDQTAKMQSHRSSGKTYYYKFSLDTELNVAKKLSGATKLSLPGTSHVDDNFYIFKMEDPILSFPYETLTTDSLELKAIRDVTKMWTNFAKYGNPIPDGNPIVFKPLKYKEINYVDIRNEGLVAGVNPFEKRMKFWDELYKKYQNVFKSDTVDKDEL